MRVGAWAPNSQWIAYAKDQIGHVVRADGTRDRVVWRGSSDFRWAPDSRRIAYVASDGVHVVQFDGSRDRLVWGGSSAGGLGWSRDGRVLAFDGGGEVIVVRAGVSRAIASGTDPALSPDGNWIAYRTEDSAVRIVRADGTRDQAAPSRGYGLAWSADSRFLALNGERGVDVVDRATGAVRTFGIYGAREPVWAPRRARLAFIDRDGIYVADAGTGTAGRVAPGTNLSQPAWSPTGDALAYRTAISGFPLYYWGGGDLNVTTLAGHVRTIIRGRGRFGGALTAFVWTRPPRATRYLAPSRRRGTPVTARQLVAPWRISALAADESRVAYVSCGHVFTWAPAAGTLVQADPVASLSPWCSLPPGYYAAFSVYSLALAGDRVAYTWVQGNMSRTWSVAGKTIPAASPAFVLETQYGVAGGIGPSAYGLGDLAGSGDLLVYTRWREGSFVEAKTTEQTIVRVDGESCPCPTIATSPGPLVPFDINENRIVAGGTNETWLLDSNGQRLLTLPVSPLAAQLSGSDLLVALRGQLRDYDATTGTLRHAWPLPDVSTGFRCGTPSGGRCGPEPRLVLDDAAHGLAAYILDGQVHLLRLADGADRIIGPGTLARFMNTGLVYAAGRRLQLVPYAQLPLLGFDRRP